MRAIVERRPIGFRVLPSWEPNRLQGLFCDVFLQNEGQKWRFLPLHLFDTTRSTYGLKCLKMITNIYYLYKDFIVWNSPTKSWISCRDNTGPWPWDLNFINWRNFFSCSLTLNGIVNNLLITTTINSICQQMFTNKWLHTNNVTICKAIHYLNCVFYLLILVKLLAV
jgi:hypothetical protein